MYLRGPVEAVSPAPGDTSGFRAVAFHDVLVACNEADGADLSLEVKWPQGGSVLWQRTSVEPTSPLPPRRVKIGTVYLRPRASTPTRNLKLFCDQIDAAGKLALDIVCLSESITMIGTPHTGPQLAEKIPGPSTAELGEAARRNHIWVVAGLYERDGALIYNSAVLFNRQGRLAGKYRKIHLPREEWTTGITPGSDYPVFKTEFGTVAIQICYDWFFPEVAEIFGLRGAEIVFAPRGARRSVTRKVAWKERTYFGPAPATTEFTWFHPSTTAAAWSLIRWAGCSRRTGDVRESFGARWTSTRTSRWNGLATGGPLALGTACRRPTGR